MGGDELSWADGRAAMGCDRQSVRGEVMSRVSGTFPTQALRRRSDVNNYTSSNQVNLVINCFREAPLSSLQTTHGGRRFDTRCSCFFIQRRCSRSALVGHDVKPNGHLGVGHRCDDGQELRRDLQVGGVLVCWHLMRAASW